MGKTSGGVRGGNSSNIRSTRKGATEQGYTDKMAKNIISKESEYRYNKDETLHIFNDKGELLKSIGGKGAEVKTYEKIPENSILTHNHPRSLGEKGIRSIGNSFSRQDIVTAVSTNAKEIRAVTPTYTFSVKRPKGGWGASANTISGDFKRAHEAVYKEMSSYVHNRNYSASAMARAEVTHFDRVMKKMAKKYGWEYSHKKG